MRAKTTPTERPLPEAAPKRARDACEDEADVRDDAGDAYAFKLLKLVLESMRPRSGTQQAWRDVELLVSHWKDRFRDLEAKESGGAVARKTTKTSGATRIAKMRLKDRVPAAAWNLVDDATPAEAKTAPRAAAPTLVVEGADWALGDEGGGAVGGRGSGLGDGAGPGQSVVKA